MKLIDKDAALTEIKKLEKLYCYDSVTTGGRVAKSVFISINDVFKSLEVKEVDLDFTKEVDMWIEDNGDSNDFFNVQELAKHFFELGMAVSNKAQKVE